VGGFLGAGKTCLILAAAQVLESRGLRCAVILNDQGDALVDEHHAQTRGAVARAVTGGCFCCKFSALLSIIDELSASSPDVIFAEPVGSCADISATVIGPLREEFNRFRLAPLTVLVDPARGFELLTKDADPDLAFLFRKQLQEADLVCWSKADLQGHASKLSAESLKEVGPKTRWLSARTGQGVQEWLDEVLLGSMEAGQITLDIDYARYARAEAALAWLNLSFTLKAATPLSPAMVMGPFLDRLDEQLTLAGIPIAHLKLMDSTSAGWLKAAVCSNGEEPSVEGDLLASPTSRHQMLVNLRAKGDPAQVRRIVEDQVAAIDGDLLNLRLDCFSPAPPMPERRVPAL
jgi:Ni2+-binding GTPase involved in maturation of urease and hydrogenase